MKFLPIRLLTGLHTGGYAAKVNQATRDRMTETLTCMATPLCLSSHAPDRRPNSNDYAANHVLHHTTGDASDYGQQLRAFREVTCFQVCPRIASLH